MSRVRAALREHRYFLLVVTVLTLVMTFPTIVYVFRTDVFWLPTGMSKDVYIKFWDIWYGKLILSGQADLLFTNEMFFPHGVTLVYHPLFVLHAVLVNALQIVLPLSNAYSLAFLLITMTCAASAYIFLKYLLNDNWIALLGSVIFGFSPHVVGHPSQPEIAFVAALPLVLYFFQRGVTEGKRPMLVAAGLLVGFNTLVTMYVYVCVLMTLGLYIMALAFTRWRAKRFWLDILLLVVVIAASSIWRVYPMIEDVSELGGTFDREESREGSYDLVSAFINHAGVLSGPFFESVFQIPMPLRGSHTSFLGYLPLVLTAIGLSRQSTRRKMMPWLVLGAVFFVLRLGSVLTINGVAYHDIILPKYYLSRFVPYVFEAFYSTDHFQIGVLLPLAVMSCYGVLALREMRPILTRPTFLIVMIAVVALEYHIPAQDGFVTPERFRYLELACRRSGGRDSLGEPADGAHKLKGLQFIPVAQRFPSSGRRDQPYTLRSLRLYQK